jgi:methionine aminopeptidase
LHFAGYVGVSAFNITINKTSRANNNFCRTFNVAFNSAINAQIIVADNITV